MREKMREKKAPREAGLGEASWALERIDPIPKHRLVKLNADHIVFADKLDVVLPVHGDIALNFSNSINGMMRQMLHSITQDVTSTSIGCAGMHWQRNENDY